MLFFHRGLKSLVAIDLKIGEFKPEYVGKMNYYLSVLDRVERRICEITIIPVMNGNPIKLLKMAAKWWVTILWSEKFFWQNDTLLFIKYTGEGNVYTKQEKVDAVSVEYEHLE